MIAFRVASLVALVALTGFAPPLAAQSAGAELPGRLERHFNAKPGIEGLTSAEARSLVEATERAAGVIAAHPGVATPPDGLCLRLRTSYQGGVVGPRALAEAAFSIAERYDARGCSARTTSGITVRLNDAARFLREDGTPVTDMGDDAGPIAVIPRIGTTRDGHDVLFINGARSVVLTRDGKPLLVPVSRERYLRYQMAERERAMAQVRNLPGSGDAVRMVEAELTELRDRIAAYSAAERASQACMSNLPGAMLGECTGANGFYSLAPDYFSRALPRSAIQVILVTTPHVRHNMEATHKAAFRWRVFDDLDYGALAALLR